MSISIDDLERAAAGGWRAPEEAPLGDWLLRAAGGFTGRANSALAIGDPGLPLPAAIDRVRDWYAERGLPAMVAVAFPVGRPAASATDRLLSGLGWQEHSSAVVMTAEPGKFGAGYLPAGQLAGQVEIAAEPDEGWLDLYRYRGTVPPPISRELLKSAPWQAFASVREAGQTVAVGRVAAAHGWAGLTAIEVAPRCRRRGLGRAISVALASAAVAQGTTGLYLQVATGNTAARALYRQVGFTDHHAYHYWRAPGGAG
jgi:ribosomal protein S18 acetylase RimI-like enzyme